MASPSPPSDFGSMPSSGRCQLGQTRCPLDDMSTTPPPPYIDNARPHYLSPLRSNYSAHAPRPDGDPTTQEPQILSLSLRWLPSSPPPPYSPSQPQLHRIVAIPQIAPDSFRSGAMPYLRAYAPELAHHKVGVHEFIGFIDGLAIAQSPSPPIKAVQAAGQVVGMVPHHWAQLASAGVGLASGAGSAAVSVLRTKKYLQEANARFFAPRQLRVDVVSDEKLSEMLRLQRGRRSLAPLDRDTGCLTVSDRRLAALAGCIAELTVDVPRPTAPDNVIDKISARSVESTLRKSRADADKKAEKAEKEAAKVAKEKKKTKGRERSRSRSRSKDKEGESDMKKADKLKWIVVENL